MQNCSYVAPSKSAVADQKSSPYNQFTALSRQADIVGVNPAGLQGPLVGIKTGRLAPLAQPIGHTTDYQCLTQCVQNGMVGGYCRQKCSN